MVFYRLNSAIERGTKPDAVGWKPYHWTSTLKAAMVNGSCTATLRIIPLESREMLGETVKVHIPTD